MRIENNLQNEEPHKDKGRQQVCHLEWVSLRGSSTHFGLLHCFERGGWFWNYRKKLKKEGCLPHAFQLGHRNGQVETALLHELDSVQQLLEESSSEAHRPYSHMQTHLNLPEYPSNYLFSTTGDSTLLLVTRHHLPSHQEMNSADLHEMGRDQAYQFAANDHQCTDPLWRHLDFLPSQLLGEASGRSQQLNNLTPYLPA